MTLHTAFVRALEAQRASLNGRFAAARRVHRGLEADAFGKHIVTCVEPIVAAVADRGTDPETVADLTESLFDLSLDLVARDLAGPGARHPGISLLWRELLPQIPVFVAEGGRDFVAALSNAIHNLAIQPAADHMRWLDRMEDLAPGAGGVDELLRLGQVLAWVCGMAHYRETAIEAWRGLPFTLRQRSLYLDATADPEEVEERLSLRWWAPSHAFADRWTPRVVATVGGFRGFGGPFMCPPGVFQVEGRLYLVDSEACFSLHADCFGAVLLRQGAALPEGEAARSAFSVTKGGEVRRGTETLRVAPFTDVGSWAATEDTLVVTSTTSHAVSIVAVVPT